MKKSFCTHLLSGMSCLLLSLSAGANNFGNDLENLSDSVLLYNDKGQSHHWTGVGRLETPGHCIATLLDTRIKGEAKGPAYILTAGHCIDQKHTTILSNMPIEGKITFNHFDPGTPPLMKTDNDLYDELYNELHYDLYEDLYQSLYYALSNNEAVYSAKEYQLKTVNWSSMRGVDLAIIELNAPLDALIKNGIQPISFGPRLENGTDLMLVGAPAGQYLRLAACQLESSTIDVIEGDWVWRNTLKNRCKGVAGGSSGSPLLDRSSNTIIGVLNTTTDSSPNKKCALNQPCEMNDGQANWEINVSYGISTKNLDRCFVDGYFNNTTTTTCPLFPTYDIAGDRPDFEQTFVAEGLASGLPAVYPSWDMKFTISTPHYRYKTVRQAKDCTSPDFYSPLIETNKKAGAQNHINNMIGPDAGLHVLCIVGVEFEGQRPSHHMMNNALSIAVNLTEVAPVIDPNAAPVRPTVVPRT